MEPMWSPAMHCLLKGPKETVTVTVFLGCFYSPAPIFWECTRLKLCKLWQLEQLGVHVFSSEGTSEMSALTLSSEETECSSPVEGNESLRVIYNALGWPPGRANTADLDFQRATMYAQTGGHCKALKLSVFRTCGKKRLDELLQNSWCFSMESEF